jgi:branched-chain amino acid transport system permease protein
VELQTSYLDQILILAVFALSLNLLMGYTGQVSVAHAAFGALGGYTLAYLFLTAHVQTLPGLVAGVAFATIVGLVIGFPALRLRTEWLILLTLAIQTIIVALVTTSEAIGGTRGLQEVTGLTVFGHELAQPSDMLPLFACCAALVYLICWRMGESPYGRVLRAIREDEIACRSLGKDVFRYKLTVFAVTTGMAGLAGALLVIDTSIASPALFDFNESTTIIAIVVLGGMGNLVGSLIGATLLVLLTPLFESVLRLDDQVASLWRLIAFGIVLVVVMFVRPQGLLPERVSLLSWLRRLFIRASVVAAGAGATAAPVVHGAPPIEPSARGERHGDVVLSVSGLSKHFGGIVAADDLSIELRRGMITALVGPNGAGKTTVFNLLTGAIRPDAGRVVLAGEEITGLRPDQIAARGMVRSFQDVRIFAHLAVIENVMLGIQHQPGEQVGPLFGQPRRTARAERAVRERAAELLAFVGMDGYALAPAGGLAFGQQKLVALARVLATEAEVLLLDEPASGIDQQWVDVMLGIIERVRERGRTVCIVEHNLHVVDRLADHTYFMELGRITAQGSFEELTSMPRLAEAYFGTA